MFIKLTESGKSIYINADYIKSYNPYVGCVDYQKGNTEIEFYNPVNPNLVANHISVDETVEEINELLEVKK